MVYRFAKELDVSYLLLWLVIDRETVSCEVLKSINYLPINFTEVLHVK